VIIGLNIRQNLPRFRGVTLPLPGKFQAPSTKFQKRTLYSFSPFGIWNLGFPPPGVNGTVPGVGIGRGISQERDRAGPAAETRGGGSGSVIKCTAEKRKKCPAKSCFIEKIISCNSVFFLVQYALNFNRRLL